MKIFLFILALLCSTATTAQTVDSGSILIDSVYFADSKIQLHDLKNYTTIFVDSSNKLSLKQIVSTNFRDKFQPVTDSMEAQPNVTYWLKFSIVTSEVIKNWWLINEDGQHSYVDVWCLNDSNRIIDHQRTGIFVPRSEKSIKEEPLLNRVFYSSNVAEKRNVYVKIYNEYNTASISSFQLRNPIVGIQVQTDYLMAAVGTAIFVISILSFFFFFFMREKAYLVFGIYTLTVSTHYLILHPALPFINWFIPEHPYLAMPFFPFLAIGGWIAFVVFGRYFINLPKLSMRFDNILKWVVGLWIICLTTLCIIMAVTRKTMLIEINFVFLLLFVIFLVRISFFKSVLVKFYVAGALWLVCFIVLGIFNVSTPLINPFPLGQLGQILIYVAGLAYKMRQNERERVEAEIVKVRNIELANLYEETKAQKQEIEVQKTHAEEALIELKTTQNQLIQSEKMASLGELTAGIAHEIQNPLNFVNNFSEVSNELLDEMKEEIVNGHYGAAIEIAGDVKQNLEKINHHGKRADAIVKGMLQHSRSGNGIKELTNINALADEYLRLAYHGLRAKDKSFNATMNTDFDENIGKIKVIPQDMGRVILNLITNAFYSVHEKKKSGVENYEPTVTVKTRAIDGKVEIRVADNGNGIPPNVLEKIFLPFFTTKPTGQGTGLGLSMSYDIVTKGHGGTLTVETREDAGSEFIILLPD